ncbi:MAG: glycosyltransferase family 2 protein [Caldilineaceae bacterium]|nr:glycosyltransferase family 2 protein [Caldilineaceae bacterium]MBP8108952.1 glycosyltransferase family 2 protein [Caldilineaceae bacterium]MBP8123842.1 glycosyltransferase family 2 protein [Caldilineaceae bacterium]MBP9073891.1 glycosyltransferase family 2 protein [Caldilineaceae bacterium]
MNPPVTVVLLTFNTRALTLSCLAAFADEAQRQQWQTIVVDNGSTDGTAEAVRAAFPQADVLFSLQNRGFAVGNNLGIERARGEVLLLLNSDVIVSPDVIQGLATYLAEHPDVGAVSPQLRTGTGDPQAFAFGDDPTLGYLLRRGVRAMLGRGPLHDWTPDRPVTADWVSGACLAVNRRVIEQIGKLDPRFFLYFEDIDWCLRMRQAGWKVVYNPAWQVTHLGGTSQPQRSQANRLYYQSMIKFYRKHYNPLAVVLLWLALEVYTGLGKLRASFAPEETS